MKTLVLTALLFSINTKPVWDMNLNPAQRAGVKLDKIVPCEHWKPFEELVMERYIGRLPINCGK